LFSEWLAHEKIETDFENLETQKLAELFKCFYVSMRQQNGTRYGKSAHINIRAGINRHLISPPFDKQMNIARDRDFQSANQVFIGCLRKLRQSESDTEKLYTSGCIGTHTPTALLKEVFVDLGLHFACRGREGFSELKKTLYIVNQDENGIKYVVASCNESEKTITVQKGHAFRRKKLLCGQSQMMTCSR